MTIIEAINRIDLIKPNTCTRQEKTRWLSTLDGLIKSEIIDKHEGAENVVFKGYDENTDPTTVLLVPAPYDELYLFWLESRIDYWNGEYAKYQNSYVMYNTSYAAFEKFYNKTHKPLIKKRFLF